jgi:hypothetical protein
MAALVVGHPRCRVRVKVVDAASDRSARSIIGTTARVSAPPGNACLSRL